jgi:hypothetical protein
MYILPLAEQFHMMKGLSFHYCTELKNGRQVTNF